MKSKIYIISDYSNQNHLMSDFLIKKLNISILLNRIEDTIYIIDKEKHIGNILFLYDWLRNDTEYLYAAVDKLHKLNNKKIISAVFNLENKKDLIKDFLMSGSRGAFFDDDSMDLISKGIKSILQGELWFSRKILAECLFENNNLSLKTIHFHDQRLTNREREILGHIVDGQNNLEIAESLGVSVNTVKTHIYRIFQKLKVSSRLQASLWALKNSSVEVHMEDSEHARPQTLPQ